jgi:trehalose 2-sulfotransferase
VKRGYVICSYARTGSTLLCRALEATGVLGRPREYLNPNEFSPEPYPTQPCLQIAEIARRATTDNGIYGLKVFCDQIDNLKGFNWVEALPQPSFIHLERRDALGQALSSVRSLQTNQWLSTHKVQRKPRYDEAAIAKQLARFAYDRGRWQMYFARNGIDPLWLVYEDVIGNLKDTICLIGERVGIALSDVDLTYMEQLSVQRDELTEEWRARYLNSRGDFSLLDNPKKGKPSVAGPVGQLRSKLWKIRQKFRNRNFD